MSRWLRNAIGLGALAGIGFGAFRFAKEYRMVNEVYNNVLMGSGEKLIYDELFEGDSVAAFFTGVEIDMREAEFEDEELNLDVYGFCSGCKILVPENVQVSLSGVNRGSGVQSDLNELAEGPVLNINYDLTCSGLMVIGTDNRVLYEEAETDMGVGEPEEEADPTPEA